ncbi:MAG: hypothetical protein IJX49_04410, partial [Clostridia bacterium]|nr:hypothetical protein [Clostridia bacterium]
MKRNFIKNILLSAFSAICAVTAVAGVAVALPTENAPAKAETAAWQTGVFEMEDGVSLKLSEANGLRFIVKMDEDVYSFVNETEGAEMGFVIAPENLMVAANGDYLNMEKQIGGAIDKNKLYQDQDGGFWYANGCIHNVMAKNITRDFVAVSYIKYGDTVRYTEYNSLARNNLYDTVNMATLGGYANEVFQLETYTGSDDPNDDNTGWYGSEVYPIVVENTTEYDALVNAVNGDVDMSNYYCVIKNNATPTYAFSNADYKPILISEALYNVRNLINGLPDSVTMPDGIGVIGRIRETEKAYNALTAAEKEQVDNYAKVESLLAAIDGYDRVYKNDATDGTVIPSYVPNYTSTVGGSATTRTDELYGNVLTVTSDANGKAALSFTNFPSVAKYEKIYFYAKVSQSCNIYLSDGTTNDGWGANWKNNWSVDGYWCNADTWRLVEIDVSSGYVGTNFALGFRADTTGFTFEISDFYGVLKGQTQTSTSFGNIADSGTTNVYGTVYNLTQGWSSDTDLGAFNIGILSGALNEGHDSLR